MHSAYSVVTALTVTKQWCLKYPLNCEVTTSFSPGITAPKLMDLEFSIVSDILFITKHKIDHNFGPNLNIEKNLSVLDSPCLIFQRGQKRAKNTFAESGLI